MEKSSDPVILNDKSIHCLMYADDIILVSTSAPGLQEKIGIISKFCDTCLNRYSHYLLINSCKENPLGIVISPVCPGTYGKQGYLSFRL